MRLIPVLLLVASGMAVGQARSHAPMPQHLEIARHTFFDFGPPNDYYEIFSIQATETGTSIERIILTPPADQCTLQSKVEVASTTTDEPLTSLLGSTNPCSIPEKELRRELKRCKKCLVFSGSVVVMRVSCNGRTRIVRSDILDRDMFDADVKTPEHTSWTMQLLGNLDRSVGPGVMEKPMFQLPSNTKQPPPTETLAIRELASGGFDDLFVGAPDKPSELYLQAQNVPPTPTATLVNIEPVKPEVYVEPKYSPLARLAHVEGSVVFAADVDANGGAIHILIEKGNPMLAGTLKNAIEGWKFPSTAAGQHIHGTVEFALHCIKGPK